MRMYAELALIAAQRRQMFGRDRFLLLAGVAATRAGWADVASRCRELIVSHAPQHLIGRYASFADALRDEDFAPFLRRMARFCPPERAEHLLRGLGITVPDAGSGESAGEAARATLSRL